MEKKRIIFMGTPIFSAKVFEAIQQAGYLIVAVVSQPDKPVGRKRELKPTPLKEMALKYNVPVLQPIKLKEQYQEVLDYKPDLIITCAYGQMVPEVLLEYPEYGCINIHASILPRLRGGAPIHKAIMYGEEETGITIMKMAKKMDAGDIYRIERVAITEQETMGTLHDKLIECASKLILECLPAILTKSAVFTPQEESAVTYAYNVSKDEELIHWNRSYEEVDRHIRSLIPSPVGYSEIEDIKYRFHKVRKWEEKTIAEDGTVLGLIDSGLAVAVDGKVLLIDEIQPAGKAVLKAKDFFNGSGKNLVGKKFTQ